MYHGDENQPAFSMVQLSFGHGCFLKKKNCMQCSLYLINDYKETVIDPLRSKLAKSKSYFVSIN